MTSYQHRFCPVEDWIREKTGLGERLTTDTLKVWQEEQIQAAWEYAGCHSSFYREQWRQERIRPGGNTSDIKNIFTTPEDIRRNPEAFLCVPPKDIARIITLRTSGSQGAPKRLYFTEEDLMATADFFEYGMKYLVKPGQRVTVYMEGPGLFSVGGLMKIALARQNIGTKIHGLIRDLAAAAEDGRDAHCFIGVPSQMSQLADHAPELRPESVLLSGDYVPESLVQKLKAIWGCEVFHHWGMTETGYGGGVECGCHHGYHLRDAELRIEIIDPDTGEEVKTGIYGEIVMTAFARKGMPLLRYRTGDIGRMIAGDCGCGSVLPRLDKVMGRRENLIFLPEGDVMSIHRLDELLFGCKGLKDYEAELESKEKLYLTIEGNIDPDQIRQVLNTEWRNLSVELCRGTVNPYRGSAKRKIRHR